MTSITFAGGRSRSTTSGHTDHQPTWRGQTSRLSRYDDHSRNSKDKLIIGAMKLTNEETERDKQTNKQTKSFINYVLIKSRDI